MGAALAIIHDLQKDEMERPVLVFKFKFSRRVPRDIQICVNDYEEVRDVCNVAGVSHSVAIIKDKELPEHFFENYTSIENTDAGHFIIRYPKT